MWTFAPVEPQHEKLILTWLDKPHVTAWFRGQGLQNTKDDLHRWVTKDQPRFESWIAFFEGKPLGYLMTSKIKEAEKKDLESPFSKWVEPGKKMITLDLLIGEEAYLGKGLASQMIRCFLLDKFADVDGVFIDPETINTKAVHVYQKAGFKKLEEFTPSWNPLPHELMRLYMEDLKPYTLTTERLILRQWKASDWAPFAEINRDPKVREFFPSILSREESNASVEKFSQSIDGKGWGFWAVSCPEVSDFIGMIGIEQVDFLAPFTPAVEIGWRLAFPFWGKGYAVEGARAALSFAFSKLQLPEIVSFTAEKNYRSRRVMEKLGMTHTCADDFNHPRLPAGHPLEKHVLYRIQA